MNAWRTETTVTKMLHAQTHEVHSPVPVTVATEEMEYPVQVSLLIKLLETYALWHG